MYKEMRSGIRIFKPSIFLGLAFAAAFPLHGTVFASEKGENVISSINKKIEAVLKNPIEIPYGPNKKVPLDVGGMLRALDKDSWQLKQRRVFLYLILVASSLSVNIETGKLSPQHVLISAPLVALSLSWLTSDGQPLAAAILGGLWIFSIVRMLLSFDTPTVRAIATIAASVLVALHYPANQTSPTPKLE